MEIGSEDPEQLTNENYDGTDDKLDESGEVINITFMFH